MTFQGNTTPNVKLSLWHDGAELVATNYAPKLCTFTVKMRSDRRFTLTGPDPKWVKIGNGHNRLFSEVRAELLDSGEVGACSVAATKTIGGDICIQFSGGSCHFRTVGEAP